MIIKNTTSGLDTDGAGPIGEIEVPASYDPYTNKLTIAHGGPQGAEGPQGIQGPIGPQGVPGPDGTSFDWQGLWNGVTAYVTDQVVELGGTTYIALQNSTNEDPSVGQPSNAFWDVFVISGMQGPTGPAGPQGATGPTGATGPAGPTYDYIQDGDPGAVGAFRTWLRLSAPTSYGVRNAANSAWVFFSSSGGTGGVVLSPDGSTVIDSSGNSVSLTQGIGADRVLTDSATLTFDFSTPGEVKADAV